MTNREIAELPVRSAGALVKDATGHTIASCHLEDGLDVAVERAKAIASALNALTAATEAGKAEARREGLEIAARWHEGEAERIRGLTQWDGRDAKYIEAIGDHEQAAEYIRGLSVQQDAGKEGR